MNKSDSYDRNSLKQEA